MYFPAAIGTDFDSLLHGERSILFCLFRVKAEMGKRLLTFIKGPALGGANTVGCRLLGSGYPESKQSDKCERYTRSYGLTKPAIRGISTLPANA